ncbi:MAG: nucleotide pyrophosphohydrolase [Myxococcota bacterium]|nr:nucleotide pyrophosphohydrolase [Myxococcota bacterium]MEC9390376.1 nucleotide pyrophosphohydrolase [Myxococcota bacterium]
MADQSISISELKRAVADFNSQRDWAQYHNPRNLAMALSVEASELLELFLWSRDDGPQPPVDGRMLRVHDELADVVICALNLANQMGIDVSDAVSNKLEKNAKKYPVAKARGRMEKSTEL